MLRSASGRSVAPLNETPANKPLARDQAEHFGRHRRIGFRIRRTSHRARRNGRIGAKLNFVFSQSDHTVPIHHQQDQIRIGPADLETEAAAFHPNGRRSAPAFTVFMPALRESTPVLSADYEGGLLHAGNNHYALGLCQQILRYALIGRSHDLRKYPG